MKHFLHDALISVLLSVVAGTFSSLSAPLLAKSRPILVSQQIKFKHPDVGEPDYRQGGTHHASPCPTDLSIVPLMPPSNLGLTVSESPTFFAYVSLASTPVEFYLHTEGTLEEVYETTFKVDKPGIVEVRLPAGSNNQKSLEVGKRYQWSLSVICDPSDRSTDYYVAGFVQRVEPSPTLKTNLANAEPMARAIAYANNGIWYDTISTLAQMRRNAPDDATLIAEWQQLLQSQRLDAIANQPLLDPR